MFETGRKERRNLFTGKAKKKLVPRKMASDLEPGSGWMGHVLASSACSQLNCPTLQYDVFAHHLERRHTLTLTR